jgi:hypothetical protein
MEKEFIPYEQALALKELGFDESTTTWRQHGEGISGDVEGRRDYYNRKGGVYTALPLYQQAFRWFREKHNLKSWVQEHIADTFIYEIRPHVLTYYKKGEIYVYANYEEAELACLKKLIEIVKKK